MSLPDRGRMEPRDETSGRVCYRRQRYWQVICIMRLVRSSVIPTQRYETKLKVDLASSPGRERNLGTKG